MASEQDIIDQAAALGEKLAEHEAAKKLEQAMQALKADVASQRAVSDFERFAQSLQQKAQQGTPIEVADKQKLETLQQAVMTNPLLANLQRAQMDYVDLLRKVDEAITGAGGVDAEAAAAAPGGGSGILGV